MVYHHLLQTAVFDVKSQLKMFGSSVKHRTKEYKAGIYCSHINSHNQVRGHRIYSSHSGVEEYPTEKNTFKNQRGTRIYHHVIADAIDASARKV